MKKRKTGAKTLTKIDPGILKSRSSAISQHATGSRGRVTTTVNPIHPSSSKPIVSDVDPLNFPEESWGNENSDSDDDNDGHNYGDNYGDNDGDDAVGGYYAGNVWVFHHLHRMSLIPVLG